MKKVWVVLLWILVAGIVCSVLDLAGSMIANQTVGITGYSITSKKMAGEFRILLISDLHNAEFGKNNEELLRQMKKAEPDLICMAGDMLNGDEPESDILVNLIEQASAIASVCVSYGNHEAEYEERYGTDLRPLLKEAGAYVLEQDYLDAEINGQPVRIGGLYGYAMPTQPGFDGEEQRFLEEFQDTEALKILLCHMPAAWIQWNSLEFWDVDLVLSGHTHGGQIKVPFLGGAYAPDQGWFPGFTDGRMDREGRTLIVTSGLGSEGWIPRVNNRPEMVLIDF